MSLQVVLVCSCVLSLASNLVSAHVEDSEWTNYRLQYGKVYNTSIGLDAFRRSIYEHNKQRIEQFSRQRPEAKSFQLELNHMADWTESELARLRGLKPKLRGLKGDADDVPPNSPEEQAFLDKILNDTSIPVPDALDWRKTPGRVSEVKDQGWCGSCWAFASTGVLEGQEIVRKPKESVLARFKEFIMSSNKNKASEPTLLSEQNLVDCVEEDHGCFGGELEDALRYVKKQGGIEAAKSYPYEGHDGNCRFDKSKVAFGDSGAAVLPVGDEQKLKEVVAKFGPVAVGINSDDSSFIFYSGGVFHVAGCRNTEDYLDHAVLVVGYGTDPDDGDYWIVKNSWGKDWGESGYIRMARNRDNMCGIATDAVIPTF